MTGRRKVAPCFAIGDAGRGRRDRSRSDTLKMEAAFSSLKAEENWYSAWRNDTNAIFWAVDV
jgi:hypothetical protein